MHLSLDGSHGVVCQEVLPRAGVLVGVGATLLPWHLLWIPLSHIFGPFQTRMSPEKRLDCIVSQFLVMLMG